MLFVLKMILSDPKSPFYQGCTFVYNRGGQLFSFSGHIEPFFVSRGPHLGHKGYLNATKIGPRGPDVARGPYVAPFWFTI